MSFGLGLMLSTIGDTLISQGKQTAATDQMKKQLMAKSALSSILRPAQEELLKRKLLIAQGFDPDTMQPIPGAEAAFKFRQRFKGKASSGKTNNDDWDI